jgi:hypothetical protein
MDPKMLYNMIIIKLVLIVAVFWGFGWVEKLSKTNTIRQASVLSGSSQKIASFDKNNPDGLSTQDALRIVKRMQTGGEGAMLTSDEINKLESIAGQLPSM